MSIANEISRLQTAKADIKSAIEAKGVSVPSSASISTYDDYVLQIQTGGGGGSEDLTQLIQRTIRTIDIPSGTTKIGSDAFRSCASLTSVTIPNSVTSIGTNAFQDCPLRSVTIPNGVTSIGDSAFYNCSTLTSINIPSGITSLSRSVFQGCNYLSSIDIPSGVTRIEDHSLQSCYSLTSIDIPSGVTYIGDYAFYGCTSLTSITVSATTPPTLYHKRALTDTNNCPIYVPSASVNAYKTATNWSEYASRIQAIP